MKQRIVTAIIAAALFLSIVLYGGAPFILMVYLIATLGFHELLKMKKISLFSFPGFIGSLALWLLLLPSHIQIEFLEVDFAKVEVALLAVLLILSYTVLTKNEFTFDDAGFIIVSVLYVGVGFYYLIETRATGLSFLFYGLFVIWANDSGAYFIGRSYGKKKLWPMISPNKTIEGSIGGIVSGVIVGIVFVLLGVFPESGIIEIILITLLISAGGQVGDLVESAFKRHYSVKDSGHILPGHGGILDRFDSLLFVLPILHFIQFV